MKPIMTDLRSKCENYMKARQATPILHGHHHKIEQADVGSKIWRKIIQTNGQDIMIVVQGKVNEIYKCFIASNINR